MSGRFVVRGNWWRRLPCGLGRRRGPIVGNDAVAQKPGISRLAAGAEAIPPARPEPCEVELPVEVVPRSAWIFDWSVAIVARSEEVMPEACATAT